jgi:chromosome segregation ATPase
MAEKAMGVIEVLSVLGQMELDLTQLIAQKRGIARIREVLTVYQESAKAITAMEDTKKDLAKEIQSLQVEYSNKRTVEHKTLDAEKERCAKECETAKVELADARKKLKAVNDDLAEKGRFATERSAQLDSELKSKTAELEKITRAFETFRKQHGLAV